MKSASAWIALVLIANAAVAGTADFALRTQRIVGASVSTDTGDGVQRTSTTVAGIAVDQFSWTDSHGLARTVSLKQEGKGNSGHGGYAVQMTYQVPNGAGTRTVTANMASGGDAGFGYFVGHELYRSFSDGSSGTIADLHGQDDSPLGLGFPVTTTQSTIMASSTIATETFQLLYPKWGTKTPIADPTADFSTPVDPSSHQLFQVPVTIVWTFQKNTDFPRIDVSVDISASTPGQLAFDMRGPYGVLEFADSDSNATINNVQWADSAYLFTSNVAVGGFLQQGSSWNWNSPVGGVRPFQGMIARHTDGTLYEIGLFELKLGADEGLAYSGYSSHRGSSGSGFYQAANGIEQYEWPFQSAQYSGSAADGGWLAATKIYGKKFAWGTAPFYGSELTTVYLNDTTPKAIDAFPAGGVITYRTCWVMGLSTYTGVGTQGLTQTVAASASPSCATGSFQSYVPLVAARLLDTRANSTTVDGRYAAIGALASQSVTDLALGNRGGLPDSSIGAVVMSVTALNAASEGFITFWPTGASLPVAGNINPNPGLTISNLIVTKVGANSRVSIFNGGTGATALVINVQGWLPAASGYNAITPARFLDTRPNATTVDNQGLPDAALAAAGTMNLTIAGRDSIPADAASAIVKITGVTPSADGYVTLWAAGQTQPGTGNVNLNTGLTMSNLAIVPIGSAGQISIYNGSTAATNLTADVQGWFPAASSFTAIAPSRLLDTRNGTALASGATMKLIVTNRAGIPASPGSVVLKLTAVTPSAVGFLTMWPSGDTQPATGNLNMNPGRTMSNLVFVKPGTSGQVSVYNGSAAAINVVVDAQGWLTAP